VANLLIALPVDNIREVVPAPRQYAALPCQKPVLAGAMNLRGDVLPVLDLAKLLARPEAGGSAPVPDAMTFKVIVVMRWKGQILGLLADNVAGMFTLPTDVLIGAPASTSQCTRVTTHHFQMADEVGSLLDPAQIAALADIPLMPEQPPPFAARQAPGGESLLLFSFRGSHFALDASRVDSAVSRTRIAQNALTMGYCLGVIDHHGNEVPVVDTLAALQIAAEPAVVGDASVVVVRFPGAGLLGFTVDDVRDIVRVNGNDILPLPPMARRNLGFFRGLLPNGGRQYLVVDLLGLAKDPPLLGLGSIRPSSPAGPPAPATGGPLCLPAPHQGNGPAASRSSDDNYLIYKAGEERASPLIQIGEILPMPDGIAPFGGSAEWLGLFSHRGVALPLVCLTTILGGHVRLDPRTARILVIRQHELAVGFAVEGLYAIEPVRWDLGMARTHQWSAPSMLPDLLMFGDKAVHRLVAHIDLVQQLRSFAGLMPQPPDIPRLCAA
jgi:purine-binding chemotaxis protein CheW